MARYVEGFVVPVPKNKLAAYRRMARTVGKVFKELGALEYVECLADDVSWGKRTSFQRAVKMNRRSETVIFAYVVYKSRRDRDRANREGIKDPRVAHLADPKNHPFDAKRMIFGGFRTIIDL